MAMMKDALTQKALSSDQDQWKRVGNSGAFSQFFSNFEHSNIGYGFYCFKNDSEKNIKVTVTLTQEQNIKVRKNLIFCHAAFCAIYHSSHHNSVPKQHSE